MRLRQQKFPTTIEAVMTPTGEPKIVDVADVDHAYIGTYRLDAIALKRKVRQVGEAKPAAKKRGGKKAEAPATPTE